MPTVGVEDDPDLLKLHTMWAAPGAGIALDLFGSFGYITNVTGRMKGFSP